MPGHTETSVIEGNGNTVSMFQLQPFPRSNEFTRRTKYLWAYRRTSPEHHIPTPRGPGNKIPGGNHRKIKSGGLGYTELCSCLPGSVGVKLQTAARLSFLIAWDREKSRQCVLDTVLHSARSISVSLFPPLSLPPLP